MKTSLLTIALVLAINFVGAQNETVQSFTLKQAVDYAIDNANSVKNARLDEKKAKAFNWEILTQGLPQLNGSFEYDHYFKVPEVPAFNQYFGPTSTFSQILARLEYIDGTGFLNGGPSQSPNATVNTNAPNPSGNGNANVPQSIATTLNNNSSAFGSVSFVLPNDITTGLTLTQLFFDARYMFGIKARKDLFKTSRLSTELSQQEIRYSVTRAYYQAAAASESKSLLEQNLKLIDTLLRDTRATYAQGLIEELDVNRLELAQATLQSQVTLQNGMAQVAMANLKFQMGLPLDNEIVLTENLEQLKSEVDLGLSAAFNAQNRIEYNLLNTAITLKGYDVKQKRSGYFPTIAGFLNYTGNVQTQAFNDMFKGTNWYPQGIVGLKVSIPIFDAGQKWAQVQQAKLEQQKAQNNFENFKQAAMLQYQSAQANFNSALADETNSQKTVDLSKKIFNKNEIKFANGAGSSFELVQSEQEFTTNQLKHMQSIMNLLNAKADLDKAMGVK
ncbi:MAG TPA: TolC family protein [Chitinophagales bacterium]|nr:TolC family protein [Chitinophagales bacterium]